jgi:hypothetical protein
MLPGELPAGSRGSRFQFRLRTLLFAVAFTALFFATNGFGIVGLRYPRAVENEPLLSPIRVTAINGNALTLGDGRVLEVADCRYPLDEAIARSDDQIDVEVSDETSLVFFHVKRRSWICGMPWVRVVNIRLIPEDVPRNRREMVGYGRFADKIANQDPAADQTQK